MLGPTPVLLIPGGAESGAGSFPGLGELLEDHRVVSVDGARTDPSARWGTVTLADRSAACLRAIRSVSAGPGVVVGHSLGGVVAVQFATDHPDAVAGLVLLDPTPFTDRKAMARLRAWWRLIALPGGLPVVGHALDEAVARLLSLEDPASRQDRRSDAASKVRAIAAALSSIPEDGQALTRRLHPLDVPVVVVTADRHSDHPMRRSHDEIALALGGQVRRWPGAGHTLHLTHTAEIAAVVRDVGTNHLRRPDTS